MKFTFDVEALEKMSIEQLVELEEQLWDERKKIITITNYKKIKNKEVKD